jgi:hypothetical protein
VADFRIASANGRQAREIVSADPRSRKVKVRQLPTPFRKLSLTTENVAYLSLLVASLALAVAIFAAVGQWAPYWADTHRIEAHGSFVQAHDGGPYNLHISVSNTGKRPTSILHLTVKQAGQPARARPFLQDGPARLDVGESATAVLAGNFLNEKLEAVGDLEVTITDSANVEHLVFSMGKRKTRMPWTPR